MAQSMPEVYPKLRVALEQFLNDRGCQACQASRELSPRSQLKQFLNDQGRQGRQASDLFSPRFQYDADMVLAEEDIMSMEDLAVACAKPLLKDRPTSVLKQIAEDLLCLLKPVGEQLLPPEGPTDVQIWETFAAAEMQQKQFCIAAVYPKKIAIQNKPLETGLQRNNFLVLAMEKKFKGLVTAFENVHFSIQAHVSAELHSSLTNFTARLNSCCEGTIRRMTLPRDKFPQANLDTEMREMTERWSRLSVQASQIAHQVAQPPVGAAAPEINSLGSWSVVSDIPRDHGIGLEGLEAAEHLEVGSVASVGAASVGSQSSCLSGHGGPHCFLPSHLFKVLPTGEAPAPATCMVWAKD